MPKRPLGERTYSRPPRIFSNTKDELSSGEADPGWTVVGIDVIRATTTAVTAVAAGRRCFPVASLEEAVPLAARLANPLLVGELGGNRPDQPEEGQADRR